MFVCAQEGLVRCTRAECRRSASLKASLPALAVHVVLLAFWRQYSPQMQNYPILKLSESCAGSSAADAVEALQDMCADEHDEVVSSRAQQIMCNCLSCKSGGFWAQQG
jgi:hypothetical protein